MICFRHACLSLVYVCALFLLHAHVAHAQGDVAPNVGGPISGPTIGNGAAIFWNPAALGIARDKSLFIDVQTVFGQGSYQRFPDENAGFYPEVDATAIFATPFVSYVDRFGLEDWTFGFGVFMPYGSGGKWPEDGPQRYHLIDGLQGSLFFTAASSVRLSKSFFIGAGVSYVLSGVRGEIALDFAPLIDGLLPPTFDPLPTEDPFFEGRAKTSLLIGHGIAFQAGILWRATKTFDFGASFVSPVSTDVSGQVEVDLPSQIGIAAPALALIGIDGGTITGDITIDAYRPAIMNLGGTWRYNERLAMDISTLIYFGTLKDELPTSISNTGVPGLDRPSLKTPIAEQKTSFKIKTGSRFKMTRNLLLAGYLAYEHSAILESATDANSIGFSLIIPSLGLEYAINDSTSIGTSLSPIIALPRTVNNSHLFDPERPTGNGDYSGFAIQFGLSLQQHF